MDIITDKNKREIESIIDNLADEYVENKALILTEGDLQCQLHMRLGKIPNLAGYFPTADDDCIKGTTVHAELSWFDDNSKLRKKPDITILDVKNLNILRSNGAAPLPSKQCSFVGDAIVLEIKFCRKPSGITDSLFKKEIMEKDFEKLDWLLKKFQADGSSNKLYCYLVIFSKFDHNGPLFENFLNVHQNDPNLKTIYKSGKVRKRS